jgi:hypothetical protein
VPRKPDGNPAFFKDVAVLAVPEAKRLPGHQFIFRLPRGDIHRIDHAILYNTNTDQPSKYGELQLFVKDFSIAVSTGEPKRSDFRDVYSGSLEPHTRPQRIDFPAVDARYVRLTIINGHNPEFDQLQLGEFEVYSTDGDNVVASKVIDRTRDSAEIIWFSSEAASGGNWTVANLHDGAKSGPGGSWSFAGPPPLVIEDASQIVNVTAHLAADQRLRWTVPPGNWTILRFVCANTGERLKVPSPNSDGLATDHFSADATRTFLEVIIQRLEQRLGTLSESGMKQLYLPSYEVVGAKWTPDFLEQFQGYRQYDMTRFLPVFAGCVVESEEQTRRFLYDFQKTLGDLLVDAYYRTASRVARQAGLGIEAEAGGPGPPVHQVPVDALKALGAIDEMRGEFWPWRQDRNGLWVVKETACAAHIYGHRRVHMESFTGFFHWSDGPFFLKPSADRAFCEGMNHVVWHTATHQPPEAGKPGWVYGAGTHLTPNLVWWPMAKPFLDYLARCSYMLQQGLFVGDVCYYYGDQGANFVPPKHVDPSLGYGYDYDVVNPEALLTRMEVQDGHITLPDGMQYELLVLPQRQDFDLDVLERVEQLVRNGATIVGPKPNQANGLTDYPNRDSEVRQLADRLWGNCDGEQVREHSYGQGKVFWGRSLRDILRQRGVGPDFQVTSDGGDCRIDFLHRRTQSADIYFVRNMDPHPVSMKATFRVRKKIPELWYPESGAMRDCPVYEDAEDGIRIPLTLDEHGSLFVVFRRPIESLHLTSASPGIEIHSTKGGKIQVSGQKEGVYELTSSDNRRFEVEISQLPTAIELNAPWSVHFLSGLGAPESVTWKDLSSWTTQDHENIRYYSGIARYETTFQLSASWLDEGRGIQLDLGRLWAVGRVRLNGQPLGVFWKPPYRMDVTSAVRAGQNRLQVDIANTWANRLIGDAQLPEARRFCQTNITRSGTPGKPWKQVRLRESGLLGPVRLVPSMETTVDLSGAR